MQTFYLLYYKPQYIKTPSQFLTLAIGGQLLWFGGSASLHQICRDEQTNTEVGAPCFSVSCQHITPVQVQQTRLTCWSVLSFFSHHNIAHKIKRFLLSESGSHQWIVGTGVIYPTMFEDSFIEYTFGVVLLMMF